MKKLSIYLAGGMSSNWQQKIINKFKNDFIIFNPRDHELDNSIEYTEWDLFYVKNADILFAFMEKDNPSGFGLTVEVGYAKALGKLIILVDEKSFEDKNFGEKFRIVRNSSSIVFDNFDDGVKYLSSFLRVNKSN
jgi:nucleoside 2-deoxyribosyltransferase